MSSVSRAWEDIKREGQRAFEGVGNAYQDILIHGRLMDRAGLYPSYFIDQDVRAEYEQWRDDYDRTTPTPDPEPEDLEPWS